MFSQPTSPSLKRRLSANFLACGTVILVALLLAAMLNPAAETFVFGPLAVSISLVGLIAMSIVLRRTAGPVCEIETQLHKLAGNTSGDVSLDPIPENDAISAAWNRMQGLVASRRSLEKLEIRVNESLGAASAGGSLQLLDSLPDGIAVTNRDGEIKRVNSSLRALLGIAADDDLAGRKLAQLLPQSPTVADGDNVAPDGNNQGSTAFEIHRGEELADGVLKTFRYTLFDGEKESSDQLWLIRDVTQQKLADEMRTQFLQTATHELRTPLMNICAYAETLELTEDLDVEQQKQFCNIINSEAMRLSRFVDELLDVNRMEAGAMSLALHETDVERLLLDVIEKVRPQMQQKQITFEANISPKLPKLNLDKDKISAALVNLLGNAAKYTPDAGSVKFTVDSVGQELEMQVEDTGYGISAEELPKVFDRFFRSEDDRVRDVPGSGLGLAFTSEVVRLHGGRIDVHSELNRGTNFTLVLPVR